MSQLILVVDDQAKLVSVVRGYLEQAGYDVVTAGNGREALFAARDHQPDLIILDMMMPVMDGLSFLREYQKEGSAPIIALTARVDETHKILGLEMGADDYITKPFSPRELTARVRAVLRRTGGTDSVEGKLLRAGNITLDEDAHIVKLNNEEIELTPMEYNLLYTLIRHPGRAFSRMELLEHAQGFAYDGYERTIDVHIKNLRKKIEVDPSQPEYVLTVFGVGYRFKPNS